ENELAADARAGQVQRAFGLKALTVRVGRAKEVCVDLQPVGVQRATVGVLQTGTHESELAAYMGTAQVQLTFGLEALAVLVCPAEKVCVDLHPVGVQRRTVGVLQTSARKVQLAGDVSSEQVQLTFGLEPLPLRAGPAGHACFDVEPVAGQRPAMIVFQTG